MKTQPTSKLHRLTDTDLFIADPAENIRGLQVLDSDGEEIGTVEDLLIDDQEKKVRFMQVATGGFLGLGERTFLIPVDAITGITSEAVHVNQTRERVAGAPVYDPDLEDASHLNEVYGYYGIAPFWGPGYLYPAYPYY